VWRVGTDGRVHHEGALTTIVSVHHEGDEKDDDYSECYEHRPPASNTSAVHPSQLEGVRGVCDHGLTLCRNGLNNRVRDRLARRLAPYCRSGA